jgi:transposase
LSLSQGSRCLSCQHGHGLEVLLPHLAGVVVERTEVAGTLLCIRARARGDVAVCPGCGRGSRRVHSGYERRLADAAVGGRRVVIRLQVRRLFCDEPACKKRTFAEQVPGLTVRYGRKTALLAGMLQAIAVALAGRAACRLARALHAAASRSTLLRLVMAIPDPAAPAPRVLGVDDFALRRGQNYGTVLIDCETGAPLDLLEGRDAKPLADWLAAHPGVEIICRDRSGAYADGARTGAPDAIQVADRFHLWQNLAKAVERCVAAHRACLGEPDPGPVTGPEPGPSAEPAHVPVPEPAGKFAERARRHHAMVHELLAEGHGMRAIARHLGWGRHTVQRYAHAATWQELVDGRWQAPRPSMLDPFKPHLHQRTGEGCGNISQLFREITARGYAGSYVTVRDYLEKRRPATAPLPPPPPPTVRQVTGWLTRHPGSLTEDEKPQLQAILERCPELQATSGHVRAFGQMLTQLTGQNLPQWISDARAAELPGMSSFAKGLEQDLDAVTQGLTSHWNSGPVEGRVNHIKMIKRQMFGRAGLPLLRKRVLLTAQGR